MSDGYTYSSQTRKLVVFRNGYPKTFRNLNLFDW